MSYILDALKKAERERGLTKVPNIETVHDIASKKKKIVWIAAECGAVCLIAAAWLYFGTSFGRVESKTPAQTAINRGSATEDSESMPETRKSIDQSSNAQSALPGAAANPPIPKTVDTATAAVPEIQPGPAAVKPENPVQSKKTESRAVTAKPSVPGIKTEPSVAAVTAAPAQKSPPGDNNAGLPAIDAAAPATVARESSKPSGNSPSLFEIAGSMKLNISFHVYSDNPERRMVFINGKRYREGDSLEQDCVLEGITHEGLILRRGEETISVRVDGGI